MKKTVWYKASGSTKYAHLPKFLFAFFSAHIIITYDDERPYLSIFTSGFYYLTLLINSAIALALILIAYRITIGLDYFYPWSRCYKKRLRWQLLFAVLFVQLLAIGFAFLYFGIFRIDIFGKIYFSRYFLLIAMMLTLLSAFLFYEWTIKNKTKSTPKSALKKQEVILNLDWAISEVACVFIKNKYYFAYNFTGEKIVWRENLTNTFNHLPAAQFYMIRNSFIVNRDAVKEVIILSSRKTKVMLVHPLNLEIEISRRENASFKKWMAKQDGDINS